MNKQLTPEQRKARLQLGLNIAGVCLIAAFVGPFAVAILHGLGAILAVAATVGISWVAMKFMNTFTLMVSNAALKSMKAEAMRNPVETLQTEYVKKQNALKDYRANIEKFKAQVLAFKDQVQRYVKEGLEDAQTYVEQLGKMNQLYDLRVRKYQEAQDMLSEFAETISRTEKKWKMACAAMAMNEAAGELAGDTFDKICIETALDSVQTKLNESFAALDIALLDDDKAKQQLNEKKLNQIANGGTVADLTSPTVNAQRQKVAV